MINNKKNLGSILGQGKESDVLIVSSIEKTGDIRKGTIVAHDTRNETILFQIMNKLTWSDISEQDLYLMNENERLAYKIMQQSPKSFILQCTIVGVIRNEGGGKQIFAEPISYVADVTPNVRNLASNERKLIYERGTLFVGNTFDGLPVTLPLNELIQRHLSVIGMTGCGKSFLIGILCEELAKHNAAILILDPHNEYLTMAQSMPNNTGRMLYSVGDEVNLNKYTLDVKTISAYDFQHFTGMGEGSTSILSSVIQNLRKANTNYTISDILQNLDIIAKTKSKSEAAAAIWARNYLTYFENSGLLGTHEPPIHELAKANQLSVVGLSGINERIQQFVVSSILKRVFLARKKREIPPLVLVIEEAHRFAPGSEKASSNTILRTLATEGRKFGICLIVVSQRPKRLDSTVLSQCVTNIVMKVKNPADLNSIKESAENVTEKVIHDLPRFEKGEALIMGEAFPISLRFKVRSDRSTKHGGRNVDFEKEWQLESTKNQRKRFEFPDEL